MPARQPLQGLFRHPKWSGDGTNTDFETALGAYPVRTVGSRGLQTDRSRRLRICELQSQQQICDSGRSYLSGEVVESVVTDRLYERPC